MGGGDEPPPVRSVAAEPAELDADRNGVLLRERRGCPAVSLDALGVLRDVLRKLVGGRIGGDTGAARSDDDVAALAVAVEVQAD
jgi:hypothetical protein